MFYFNYDVVIACVVVHEHLFLYTHTHQVASDDHGFARPGIFLDTFLYYSGVRVIVCFTRSWSFSLFVSGILTSFYSFFFTFLDSCISDSAFILILFVWYHALMLICDIAVIVDWLWFRFITCLGYSHRDSVFMYFRKRGVTLT